MTHVRNAKNEDDYVGEEYDKECSECERPLAVLPPEKFLKKARESGDDADLYEWLGDKYFYCPKCQKDLDYPAII